MTLAEKADDKKFNETLKRMLKTPPKPHEKDNRKDAPKSTSGQQKRAPTIDR